MQPAPRPLLSLLLTARTSPSAHRTRQQVKTLLCSPLGRRLRSRQLARTAFPVPNRSASPLLSAFLPRLPSAPLAVDQSTQTEPMGETKVAWAGDGDVARESGKVVRPTAFSRRSRRGVQGSPRDARLIYCTYRYQRRPCRSARTRAATRSPPYHADRSPNAISLELVLRRRFEATAAYPSHRDLLSYPRGIGLERREGSRVPEWVESDGLDA